MKACIFSDVHGNFEAFRRMLSAEKDVTCFIFSGDIFGYFYGQPQIIDEMMSRNIFAVKGNHDVNYLNGANRNEELIDKYGSSYCTVLSERQMNYLSALPEYLEIEIFGKRFGVVHGGLEDHLNQRIYPDSTIQPQFTESKFDCLILGHTHYRFARREGNTLMMNPGSLGQPRDGLGFSYCVLNLDNMSYEFKTIDLDIEILLEEVRTRDFNRHVYHYLAKKYGRAL